MLVGLVVFLASLAVLETSWFRSVVFSVPTKFLITERFDLYTHISAESWRIRQSPQLEHYVLIGSSAIREATGAETVAQKDLSQALGRDILYHKVAGSVFNLFEALVIVENLPKVSSGMLILGTNWASFNRGPEFSAENSYKLRLVDYPKESIQFYENHGVEVPIGFSNGIRYIQHLNTWIRAHHKNLLRGQITPFDYTSHGHFRPGKGKQIDAEKIEHATERLKTEAHSNYWKFREFNFRALIKLIEMARERGYSFVIVEPPQNPYADPLNASVQQDYRAHMLQISDDFDVPYLNFYEDLNFKMEDFTDFVHLLPPGRKRYHEHYIKELQGLMQAGDQD